MAPVTRRKSNHFPTQHDEDDHEESGHEEQRMTNGDNEEVQAAMRAQIEDLTDQLAESCLYDRRRCRTPPRQEEEEDEGDYGYESANPFAERRMQGCLRKLMLIGGRAGSNWIFQNFQGDAT
jgi:hypothetical protein